MYLISILLAATFASKADVPRVTVAELHDLMKKGDAIAIDVRGSVPHKLGHIEGAVWMPLGLLNQRAGELSQEKLIVPYCTCKAEDVSLEAAMVLANQHGFTRVAVLKGGYPAWKDAGLPVVEERDVTFPVDAAPATPAATPATPAASGGRLRPPDAVTCDRNNLTSHAGKVASYKRAQGTTTIVLNTSADTVETISITHKGSDDGSKFYLLEGAPFTAKDWARIESKKGVLRPETSAVVWICTGGSTIVDWRPGTTFTGAE